MVFFYLLTLLFWFNLVICNTGLATGLRCGDGKCAGDGIETCFSCPLDCGKCKFDWFQSCVKPGMFALTFDDGPTDYTEELLGILEKYKVKATFFVIGIQLNNPKYGPKLKTIFDAGHSIGSHTWSHPWLPDVSDQGIQEEMKKTEELIIKYINRKPIFMRCPRLALNDRVIAVMNSLGYEPAQVNLDTYDWAVRENNPNEIHDSIARRVRGSNPSVDSFISLQHETTRPVLARLPEIIKLIRDKGYTLVTIETCRGYPSAYHDNGGKSKLVDTQNTTSTSSSSSKEEQPTSNSTVVPTVSKSESLTININFIAGLTFITLSLLSL